MRWLLLLTAGCYQPTPQAGAPCGSGNSCPGNLVCESGFCVVPGTPGGDAADPDAPPDTPVIPSDACTTFASQLDTCTVSPGGPLNLSGTLIYNTNTHQLNDGATTIPTTSVQITGPAGPIDAIVTESFTLSPSGRISLIGGTPFGIVSFGTLTINGILDGASGGAGSRGPNACGASRGANGTTDAAGSSGAGGGGFQGTGGEGGIGDQNGAKIPGGAGGSAVTIPAGPLGGCLGGTGGGGVAGLPGQGGGAVYLVAHDFVTIGPPGVVDVGGGGGGFGHSPSGAGGGGGSGGMIVIEAPVVNVAGVLVSNGGGGGGGADNAPGDGADGRDGRFDAQRASGGTGANVTEGGDGGSGGAGSGVDGGESIDPADNGAGGGGGACGFIAIGAGLMTISGVVSPVPSTWPTP